MQDAGMLLFFSSTTDCIVLQMVRLKLWNDSAIAGCIGNSGGRGGEEISKYENLSLVRNTKVD